MPDENINPLLNASSNGNLEAVKILLENHPPLITQTDDAGNTAFIAAALQGHLNIVEYLIEKDPSLSLINQTNNKGNTALILAASRGHLEVVKFLVEKDPSLINKKNSKGRSAFFLAAYNKHVEVAEYLIEKDPSLINQQDIEGNTAFRPVAASGNMGFVKYLVERGANFYINPSQNSPIDAAKANDHTQIVKYLKENKELIDLRMVQCFSTKRSENAPIDLLEKILTKYSVKQITEYKEAFKKFIELHPDQRIPESAMVKFVTIMNDFFLSAGEVFPESTSILILKTSINAPFNAETCTEYYKAMSYLILHHKHEWFVANGFECNPEKLTLINAVNTYITTSNIAIQYTIEQIEKINQALANKKISLDDKTKRLVLDILKNIPEDIRSGTDKKIIASLDAELNISYLSSKIQESKKDLIEAVQSYNKVVNPKTGAKVSSKAGSKSAAPNSSSSQEELLQTKIQNIQDIIDKLLEDTSIILSLGSMRASDIVDVNTLLQGQIKQNVEKSLRDRVKIAKGNLGTALNNIIKLAKNQYSGQESTESLKEKAVREIDSFVLECSKLRIFLKENANSKDISEFISRISAAEVDFVPSEGLSIDFLQSMGRKLSKEVYDTSDNSLVLEDVEGRYTTEFSAAEVDNSKASVTGHSIGLDTFLGRKSVVDSLAGSMVVQDSGDRYEEVVFKSREVEDGKRDDEEVDPTPAIVVSLPDNVLNVLYKLKDPISRKNFREKDMNKLLSGFKGGVLVKVPIESGFQIELRQPGKKIKITSTHNPHGSKASGSTGDFDLNFLKELSKLLEEAGIYEKYGLLDDIPTSGGASGAAPGVPDSASAAGLAAGASDREQDLEAETFESQQDNYSYSEHSYLSDSSNHEVEMTGDHK